jgi:hypothetical protein
MATISRALVLALAVGAGGCTYARVALAPPGSTIVSPRSPDGRPANVGPPSGAPVECWPGDQPGQWECKPGERP